MASCEHLHRRDGPTSRESCVDSARREGEVFTPVGSIDGVLKQGSDVTLEDNLVKQAADASTSSKDTNHGDDIVHASDVDPLAFFLRALLENGQNFGGALEFQYDDCDGSFPPVGVHFLCDAYPVWQFVPKGKCKLPRSSHSCPVCNKTFTQRKNLLKHELLHTGERPFACNACNKTFTQKAHLQNHWRTHTGEKPFECSICHKRFGEKRTLIIHTRTHTGERPYACDICAKSFVEKAHLQVHLRSHTGEKPFTCNRCGKTFSTNGSLTRHLYKNKEQCATTAQSKLSIL